MHRKLSAMLTAVPKSDSDLVRQYASEVYLSAARRKRSQTFAVNVGEVHKALHLNNRVPLVCAALSSKKFLIENGLRLVSKTGPPSGQSTTVTFTYEFVDRAKSKSDSLEAWKQLRGIAKDIFSSLGGGEAFIREERANFYGSPEDDPLERDRG
jgi:hypothetical protein